MQFRLSDTFTVSRARLSAEEQKLAKITALDLQLDLASRGLQFHRLDRARDKRFWSVRTGCRSGSVTTIPSTWRSTAGPSGWITNASGGKIPVKSPASGAAAHV
jgi:hypothetical protein